jgi:hypothetical protein
MDQNNTNELNVLGSFLDSFISQPKFSGMTEEEKVAFKQTLAQNFNDRVSSVVILNMPQDKSEEFNQVLERNNPEETDAFILKYIPNIDQLIQNETSAFVNDLIATQEN